MSKRIAFTLIELLVVLALIAVLAGLAIYFVPSFQTSERAARGAGNLQTWLQSARQRAIRDREIRGLRIQFDPATKLATKAMYLEVPDDLGSGRFFDAKLNDWRSLQLSASPDGDMRKAWIQSVDSMGVNGPPLDFGPGFSKDPIIQAGDYIEFDGVGLPRQIVDSAQSDKTKPVFDMIVLKSPLPEGITSPVKHFRVMRAPRPTGDEVLDLPKTIAVDANTNDWYDGKAPGVESLPISAVGNLDIMFAPTGRCITKFGKPHCVLWVRSTDEDSAPAVQADWFRGEPTLIVIYVDSGMVAAYQVNTGNVANPYDLVK